MFFGVLFFKIQSKQREFGECLRAGLVFYAYILGLLLPYLRLRSGTGYHGQKPRNKIYDARLCWFMNDGSFILTKQKKKENQEKKEKRSAEQGIGTRAARLHSG